MAASSCRKAAISSSDVRYARSTRRFYPRATPGTSAITRGAAIGCLRGNLGPRRPGGHAPINALQQHRHLGGRQRDGATILLRPDEPSPRQLEPLGIETKALAVPVQRLEQVASQTSFSIPIAVGDHRVSLASAPWRAVPGRPAQRPPRSTSAKPTDPARSARTATAQHSLASKTYCNPRASDSVEQPWLAFMNFPPSTG